MKYGTHRNVLYLMWEKHKDIDVEVCGEVIPIDEKLVDLFKIINKDRILTSMSCQYNRKGYAFFTFDLYDFSIWCDKVSKAAIKYIESKGVDKDIDKDIDKEEEDENTESIIIDKAIDLPIVKRFCENLKKRNDRTNQIKFSYYWYSGYDSITPSVQWLFLQEDIPEIIEQLKEINV